MSAMSSRLRELEEIVGEENLLTATAAVSEYQLEGQMPVAVALPGSAEEVARLLRIASEAGLSVLLRGAGAHLHLGVPPSPIGLVVSLARLNRVVEYDADDLTVTVEAGVSLGQLARVVGEHGQMLPLDPPGPDSATLGGIAATNLAGPLRMRYGEPRDLAIGLRAALTDGSVVKAGGKTVKNVAGYELGKLFVGSLGTVGAICELTLRLVPIPEARAMVVAAAEPKRACEIAAQVVGSRLDISSVEVANWDALRRMRLSLPVTTGPEAWVVFVGLLGEREALARQEQEVRSLVSDGCARLDGVDADEVWRSLRGAGYPGGGTVAVCLTVPMASVREIVGLVPTGEQWWAVARSGEGRIYIGPAAEAELSNVQQRLAALREWAEEREGSAVLEWGPVEVKRAFPVWGDSLSNLDLMQELKGKYDPNKVLGCGRYLPGL